MNHFLIKRPVLSRPSIFPSLCFAVLGLERDEDDMNESTDDAAAAQEKNKLQYWQAGDITLAYNTFITNTKITTMKCA